MIPTALTGTEGSTSPCSGGAFKPTGTRSVSSWGLWACKAVQPRAKVRTTVPAADLESCPDLIERDSRSR